jgi:hypothetical protein
MIGDQIRQLPTGPRELRKFGLLVGGVLALLAGWWWIRGSGNYVFFLAPALPLIVLGLVWPASLKWIYLGWMAVGLALGLVVSTLLLIVVFYLVVTPMGVLARCMGKDFLTRRMDPSARTYWIPHQRSGSRPIQRYEQQF